MSFLVSTTLVASVEGLQGIHPVFLWPEVKLVIIAARDVELNLVSLMPDSPNCHREELRVGMVFEYPRQQFFEVYKGGVETKTPLT